MKSAAKEGRRWWGEFEVPLGSTSESQIGPLRLRIQRDPENWTLATERDPDPFLDAVRTAVRSAPIGFENEAARIGTEGSAGRFRLLPAHADRPVVVTPEAPFSLPPRRSARLFVSLPLWYQIVEPGGTRAIFDEAIFLPSDTWHGANTMLGELCYSSRTRARTDLYRFPPLPHRVVAPLEVRNSSDSDLVLEKVKIPVAYLSVLVSEEARLWTETVVFERGAGEASAEVRIENTTIPRAGKLESVAAPRRVPEKKFVWQAFGNLFG